MKIDRLVAITMLLLERKMIKASELSEKLEVSSRTIYRDLDTLNMAGLPIITTRGANGGVSLMDSYKVDKKLFSPHEVIELMASLKSYQQLENGKNSAATLTKLLSITGEDDISTSFDEHYLQVDLALSEGNKFLREALKDFEIAINEQRLLEFDYMDKKGETSHRMIETYKVVFKESHWYIQAFCLKKNDYRIFKLARMSQIKLLIETFIPRNFVMLPMNETKWMEKKISVKLKINPAIREQIIEKIGADSLSTDYDGNYFVHYPIADNEYGYDALLRFGDKCEILEPEEVRRKFKQYVEKIAKQYD